MMYRTHLLMKKTVFNGKLNRVKFINNKKNLNMSKANLMVKRQIHYINFMNRGPPENDWLLFALCAIVGYSISKLNGRTK